MTAHSTAPTSPMTPDGHSLDSSALFTEAGVKVGDVVMWSPLICLGGIVATAQKVTVKGIHLGQHDINKGHPAILVENEHGRGYRAYPGEFQSVNKVITQPHEN